MTVQSPGNHESTLWQAFSDSLFTSPVIEELKNSLGEAQRLAEDGLVKRRLEKVAVMTDYTDRLTAAFRLARNASNQKNQAKKLDLLKQAYLTGDAEPGVAGRRNGVGVRSPSVGFVRSWLPPRSPIRRTVQLSVWHWPDP